MSRLFRVQKVIGRILHEHELRRGELVAQAGCLARCLAGLQCFGLSNARTLGQRRAMIFVQFFFLETTSWLF